MSDESDIAGWHSLDTYETSKFIEDVKDPKFAGLFSASAYELYEWDLDFFDGYHHYLLLNNDVFPAFVLQYISNGEDHYFLDGSEHCLEMLIQKDCLRLSQTNVLDYLGFHSDVAFYPYRKVKFITDPTNTPYSGASAMGHHFKSIKYHAKMEVEESEADDCFYVRMPVLYNGDTVEGYVQVMKNGQINILEPVTIPLMDKRRDHNPLDYDHPHEQELTQQNLDIIRQSEEGRRLYSVVEQYGGKLRFVSGVGSNGYASHDTGYIVAPENLDIASPYQIITIIGVLREMEMKLMGHKRPDPFGERPEIFEEHLALNLDIVREICIIIDELVEAGHEDILRKFKKAGFEEFYSGYKNKVEEQELARILAKRFRLKVE